MSERRVYIETYGCQMNVSDSEMIGGALAQAGFPLTDRVEEADVILLNTCAVRENAEQRVFGRASHLLQFRYARPELVIGIIGCMAEHLRAKILDDAPYVDLVLGPDSYRRLPEILARISPGDPIIDVRLDRRETYEGMPAARGPGVSGQVTIQRGCDKFCTFCIVPWVRGRERGVSPREVLRQVHDLAALGYREVTLLGQTVNSYRHEDVDFADLLRAVAQVPGIDRVRYTSPYPVDFSSKLICVLAELRDRVQPYLHLPLQSGADTTLERMRRGYSAGRFRSLVGELRARIPGIAISTDIITGFPGETEDEFRQTVAALTEMQFDSAFLFAYSERDGTLASRELADDVPAETKQARLAECIAVQESISRHIYGSRVGSEVDVLVENASTKGPLPWFGRTPDFKMSVFDDAPGVGPGALVRVRIASATSHTLRGSVAAVLRPAGSRAD